MVEWVDGALQDPGPASARQVIETARALRCHFPEDYLDVAMAHPGARPEPAGFTLPNGSGQGVEHLLHFEPGASANLLDRRFFVEGVIGPEIVPFAEVTGGDLLCFDFSAGPDDPTIAFWSVDDGLVPLARTFTEFLTLLHD